MRSNSPALSIILLMCRHSFTFTSAFESSAYGLSIQNSSLPEVTESPVANKVTSAPLATKPSAKPDTTCSHGPYLRGGVRQATGERSAIFILRLLSELRFTG